MSIEVSENESVRGVRKDVRIEGPGARIRRTVSDGRGVKVNIHLVNIQFKKLIQ